MTEPRWKTQAKRVRDALPSRARVAGTQARLLGRTPPMTGQRLRAEWRTHPINARAVASKDEPRVLLIHVPKTGGSSLRQMFESHVSPEKTFLARDSVEWAEHTIAAMREYNLFVGHNFVEPLYLFPDDDWTTILPVREPVSWWESWYKFRRRQLTAAGIADPAVDLDFDRWLATCTDDFLSNAQSSWLMTRVRVMFDNPWCPPDRIGVSGLKLRRNPEFALQTLAMLMDRTTVVGVTEDLHSIYLRTCRALGWEPVHERAIKSNSSWMPPEVVELSSRERARLLDLNRIDTWLYERARDISSSESV